MAETMEPYIVDETEDYAVVFKPPRMHCAPLRGGGLGGTLFDWYAARFPAAADIAGRKKCEGGLLHRLDFETQGLALFAKTQPFADSLLAQQRNGTFIKEYSAVCVKSAQPDSTLPPPPCLSPDACPCGFVIESFFRPYGPGRKQVRPVTGTQTGGGLYRTEIIRFAELPRWGLYAVTARLVRGFRHQVRCHLAWIGCPVANDPLYGGGAADGGGFLALRACALAFTDPRSGAAKECRVEPM